MMRPVTLIKAKSTDAFVVVDLDGAEVAAGIVRNARKVLQDGARNLARSATYTYAVLGLEVSGASAAVNADGDARDAAVAAFVEEFAARDEAPRLLLDAGKGIRPDELAPLRAGDDRNAVDATQRDRSIGIAAVAALGAALGSVDGTTVAAEPGAATDAALDAFREAGASVVTADPDLTTSCDALLVGSKVGAVAHEMVPSLATRCLVPLAPLAVTARALAVAKRNGIAVLPDFVIAAGPALAAWTRDADPAAVDAEIAGRVGAIVADAGAHAEGHVLGACEMAETFLSGWSSVPFGRPL